MTEPSRPTFLRRRLGAKLRRLREQAGMTLDDAAPKLDKARSSLHRIETGETRADVHIVRSMMDVYDCYSEGLLEQTREALKPPWYRAFGITKAGYVDVETEAMQVNQYLSIDIPGLLQTEAYMRALFSTGYSRTAQALNNDVMVRLIRQRRLTSEDRPLELVAIIYEAALHRVVGDLDVMREQLRHLIEMAALPTVTLRMIPLHGARHRVPIGPFTLLSFQDPDDPELLYIEHPAGALHIEDVDQVQIARLAFDQWQTNALGSTESLALIERLETELYGP